MVILDTLILILSLALQKFLTTITLLIKGALCNDLKQFTCINHFFIDQFEVVMDVMQIMDFGPKQKILLFPMWGSTELQCFKEMATTEK